MDFQVLDLSSQLVPFRALQPLGDNIDRLLELFEAVPIAVEQAHSQWPYGGRQLIPQYSEGGRLLRGDEHPFSKRQIVADDIGDRMGLTRTGGALNDDTRPQGQALHDLDLFAVEGLRKK